MTWLDTLLSNPPSPPKQISEEPVYISNTFLAKRGEEYLVFPIKLEKRPEPGKRFIRIEKSPPVLCEGILTYKKRSYLVSVKDLLRRRVDVHKRIPTPRRDHVASGGDQEFQPPAPTVQHLEQSGLSEESWDQISKLSHVAVQEQVETLLHTQDQEGPWRPSDSAQSLSRPEGGPVPDPDPDPGEDPNP